MAANTPKLIDALVLDFCNSIRPDVEPVYVQIRTETPSGFLDCYGNVKEKISKDQGRLEYGWAIWLDPEFLIEAMHHAIWISPEGERVCVSPHIGDEQILFLPAPDTPYQGKPIGNIRKGLKDDPRMSEYIRLNEEADKLIAAHAKPDGTRVLTPEIQDRQRKAAGLLVEMGWRLSQQEIMEIMAMMKGARPVNLTPNPNQSEDRKRERQRRKQMMDRIKSSEVPAKNPKERAEDRKRERKRQKKQQKRNP